jgi:hypothetical protein
MSATAILGIIVLALAIVAVVAWYTVTRRRRTQSLHAQYGSEYERALANASSKRAGEAELVKRQERVEQLAIRPLTPEQREMYGQQWRDVQEAFVDSPGRAVTKADSLVAEVMRERGYPMANFEQRAADLSVNHASLVQNYRAARDVAERHRRGIGTTEELRRAMVYYREMFEDLLRPDDSLSDRPVSRTVEREVPLPLDRAGTIGERVQRPPIAPPPDREVR